jgi:hypothetical protein
MLFEFVVCLLFTIDLFYLFCSVMWLNVYMFVLDLMFIVLVRCILCIWCILF